METEVSMTYQMWQLTRCPLTVKEVTVTRRTPATVWIVWESSGGRPIRQPRHGCFFDTEKEAWQEAAKEAKRRVQQAESELDRAKARWRNIHDELKARRLG